MVMVVWKHKMIMIIITHLKITTKIIITQKMKKMMIITLMNLKMMIKIKMLLINQKNLQIQKEEEVGAVNIIPYQEEMTG